MNIASVIQSVKELLTGDNKYTVLVMTFSGLIIWYQYNSNLSLEEKITKSENTCDTRITKIQEQCQEQINLSRSKQQEQLDAFVLKSNLKMDSLYSALSVRVRTANTKVNKSLTEIKDLTE
jgi:hypothetical protein